MKKLCLALFLVSASGAASANLVQNGSFEQPGQANGTWNIYPSIPGWSSTIGEIEVRNNVYGTASDGVNFVELDANHNSDMWQVISTTAGTTYELEFDYSPRVNQPLNTNGISVYWNGTLLQDITALGGSNNLWTTYTFQVTGTGSDTLKFWATGSSDSLGGNVDNVELEVNAVPLPGAAWLFGSALLGAGVVGRRKQATK